ncbi:MAG: hypothetical protein IPH45_20305 [Bacteroidales bacterium]|nr:hypothetical protein [Bacteroidales bacterium]
MSHSSNNLIFHFASLNYLNPEQTLYRYKLEGLSNKWSEYSTETKAIFTSLNPGSYKIIIESYNRLDNSKVQKIEFSFSIKHPWYLNIWFITFSIVLIICCIYLIIHLRTNQIKEEEAKKSDFTKQLATIEMRTCNLK